MNQQVAPDFQVETLKAFRRNFEEKAQMNFIILILFTIIVVVTFFLHRTFSDT